MPVFSEYRHTDKAGATLVVRRTGSVFDSRILDGTTVVLDDQARLELSVFLQNLS